MAGGGAKKRAEENKRTVRLIGVYILVCASVFALVRLWWKSATLGWGHYAGFAGTMAMQGLGFLSIAAVARPIIQNGAVVDGGGDLTKGTIQYYFDLVYVTGFSQVCAAFSDWGWYLLLLVPSFGLYLSYTKVIKPLMAASKQEDAPVDEATRKKLERTAQRAERRRVKRI